MAVMAMDRRRAAQGSRLAPQRCPRVTGSEAIRETVAAFARWAPEAVCAAGEEAAGRRRGKRMGFCSGPGLRLWSVMGGSAATRDAGWVRNAKGVEC